MHWKFAAPAAAIVLAAAPFAAAHEELVAVGQVTSIDGASITVRTKEGRTLKFALTSARIYLDRKSGTIADITKGATVTVVGFGDDYADMLVQSVTITAS
jgi:hypothetical protein